MAIVLGQVSADLGQVIGHQVHRVSAHRGADHPAAVSRKLVLVARGQPEGSQPQQQQDGRRRREHDGPSPPNDVCGPCRDNSFLQTGGRLDLLKPAADGLVEGVALFQPARQSRVAPGQFQGLERLPIGRFADPGAVEGQKVSGLLVIHALTFARSCS